MKAREAARILDRRDKGNGAEIRFLEHEGAHAGMGRAGRQWRITPSLTGWRLEFQDPGDEKPTYAGTHPSVAAAKTEADS